MDHDSIGGAVPRRGNAFSRWLGRMILRLGGWRIVGNLPDCPKMVIIGAPHTSNMDALVTLGVALSLQLDFRVMIKASAFRGPLGRVLRWLGALPIERARAGGVVRECIDAFAQRDRLLLCIAPEGTRSAPAEWKRGYYYVAAAADVPILPAAIDYDRRRVCFMPPIHPSGDYDQDWPHVLAAFRPAHPRHPERMSKPLCDTLGWPYCGTPKQDASSPKSGD